MGKIVVVGSANVGVEVPPFQPPKLGAVVDGPPFDFGVGGSALNTATVAARLGASVSFLGMVGDDLGGNLIYEHFQREGVDVSRIQRLEGRPSPSELVFFGQNGERGIVRHAGTNIDFRLPENAFRVPCRMAH
ncbi:MAG: carbohydrate kinase family protein, partial [Planctomycetota bacterium]